MKINKLLNLKGTGLDRYKQTVIYDNEGVQYVFKFDNGYGASVVKRKGSYGYERDLWELTVILWDNEYAWHSCYDTVIIDDVIGHLTDDMVATWLKRIKNL